MATSDHNVTGTLEKRYLTAREAAAYLGVAAGTFRNSWHRWGVPVIRLGGRVIFEKADLDIFMAEHKVYPQGCSVVPQKVRSPGVSDAEVKVVAGGIFDQ